MREHVVGVVHRLELRAGQAEPDGLGPGGDYDGVGPDRLDERRVHGGVEPHLHAQAGEPAGAVCGCLLEFALARGLAGEDELPAEDARGLAEDDLVPEHVQAVGRFHAAHAAAGYEHGLGAVRLYEGVFLLLAQGRVAQAGDVRVV